MFKLNNPKLETEAAAKHTPAYEVISEPTLNITSEIESTAIVEPEAHELLNSEEPDQKMAPTHQMAVEKKRDIKDISRDYKQVWSDIADYCISHTNLKNPIMTLTNTASTTPYFYIKDADKFEDALNGARSVALEYLTKPRYTVVSNCLDRIAELYAESQAAKAAGRDR